MKFCVGQQLSILKMVKFDSQKGLGLGWTWVSAVKSMLFQIDAETQWIFLDFLFSIGLGIESIRFLEFEGDFDSILKIFGFDRQNFAHFRKRAKYFSNLRARHFCEKW